MRKCDDCKIILEDSAKFCPKCGRGIGDAAPGQGAAGDAVSLLASANLHRMRGELDEAASDASKALQQNPNNPDAAALLANIYDERGDLPEAAVWYRIATDLDPANTLYKAQLDRIGKALVTRGRRGAGASKALSAPVLWALGVGLVAIIVASVVFFGRGGPAKPAFRPRVSGQAQVRIETPEQALRRRTAPTQQPGTGASRTAAQPQGGAKTPAEVAIAASVNQTPAVTQAGAAATDVVADPRQGVVLVTFSMPGTGMLSKDKIFAVSEAIARSAFAANSEVRTVTARCVILTSGAGGSQIGFVGDVSRQAIQALPIQPTAEQIASAFANQWWNPGIR